MDGADICVINTCSVTDFADRKCRKAVRAALRVNPASKIIVIGCYAQLKPDEISKIEGVDLVLGASEKFKILDYVDNLQLIPEKGWSYAPDVLEANTFVGAFSFGDRTRSFLKVQDGCDYNCSFCTIPQARGKSRSDSISSVISNVQKIGALGIKEIVLTGINLGDFGSTNVIEQSTTQIDVGRNERNRALFIDLIQTLDQEKGVDRFRLSSIEPNLCTDDIIDFVASSRSFMPHFHMPLQSGNDKQLRMMRRRYKRDLYANRVARIRKSIPHACIGVDVIVGFPGETREDFQETIRFIDDLDISYLHVFTYSERPNTHALTLGSIVSMDERRERNRELHVLSEMKKAAFADRHIDQVRPVLIEKSKVPGKLSGFTDNYIKIDLSGNKEMINTIQDLRLSGQYCDGLVTGELISKVKTRC